METASEAEEPTGYVSADDELGLENPADVGKPQVQRRMATVFDAVAGRVSNKDLRYEEGGERSGGPRIKHSQKDAPFAPDEVLFRRRGAPERYAEYDIYHAHERDLPRGGRDVLPESDLLKAVHSYASHFYAAASASGNGNSSSSPPSEYRRVDSRSMDETALLAFGILLEEAGREVLGRRGDLVFTEAAAAESHSEGEGHEIQEDRLVPEPPRVMVGMQDVGYAVPARKRRRVKKDQSSSPEPGPVDAMAKGEER